MLMVFDVVVWKLALFAIGETGTVLRACPCLALYRSYQFSQLVDNRDVFFKALGHSPGWGWPTSKRDGVRDALHQGLGSLLGLNCALLQVVYFLKLLLDPCVPQMERYLLLLAFGVEFAGRYGEDKVSVLFVVDNFQRKTTLKDRKNHID